MDAGVAIRLEPPGGGAFWFDPGALCLKWALSGGEGFRAVYETLHSQDDLRRWTQLSIGVEVPRVTQSDLTAAKRLRAAIWRCADARAEGRRLPSDAVYEINKCAQIPPPAPQIVGATESRWADPVTSRQVLSTVARDAVDLFTSDNGHRVRRCEGANCTLIFVDTSRPGRRRWCAMERCGNRAKVSAFRNRQKEDQS